MLDVLDAAVGLAFVAAGLLAGGSRAQRLLLGAVGAAWWLGSVIDAALTAHQGVLAIALLTFPPGRIHGMTRWLLVGAAALAVLGFVPQLGVVALFAATAMVALTAIPSEPSSAWCSAAAGASVATVLAWVWSATQSNWRSWSPTDGVIAYDTVLLLVAVGLAVTSLARTSQRALVADRLLIGAGLDGLDGLARILGATLSDPGLRLLRWDDPTGSYVDSAGVPASTDPARRLLVVGDPDRRVAVEHRSLTLEDPQTASAVAIAIELVEANVVLQDALRRQLGELDAARRRTVAATDHQRAVIATRLRDEVINPLAAAAGAINLAALDGTRAGEIVDVAVRELTGASAEMEALVAGVPCVSLTEGSLLTAIHEVAARSPMHVDVAASGDLRAHPVIATAVWYVVSEGLANAAKHAESDVVAVRVVSDAGSVAVAVEDDGRGGADSSGSGLQGLADRVAAVGGRFEVRSPVGAGTTIVATFGASRPSSRASAPSPEPRTAASR